MNKVRFKKGKFYFNYRFIILFSIIISFIISYYISDRISYKVINYSKAIIRNNNHDIFKKAYGKAEVNLNSNDLIHVIKNSDDEILEVSFDMEKCNEVVSKITDNIDIDLNKNSRGYVLYVPLGFSLNNILYSNKGPKIPVVINTVGSALGNVRTKITEYGINSALVQIYIDIDLKVEVNMPFNKDSENISYSSLVASKIINGKVPTFYDGTINSKSKLINIPIK